MVVRSQAIADIRTRLLDRRFPRLIVGLLPAALAAIAVAAIARWQIQLAAPKAVSIGDLQR